MADLVTFGETMLRYAPPRGKRFENADAFAVHVGGAESNVAVAAARLGHDATWLSKLPDTPFGHRVARTLRGQGVTPEVVWTEEGRLGVYYLEPGADPRGASVHYDREGAAVRTATPAELATDRIDDAEALCTTGITPALSGTLADTTRALLETAREAGTTTAFDVNHRSKLWDSDTARETLTDLLGLVDVLFVADRDAATVFDRTGDAEAVGRAFIDAHGHEAVVVTRGAEGAVAVTPDGAHEQPAFDTETVDPVGSGDAFVGGYLARRLDGGDVPAALAYGAATAAVKRTLDGDMALVSRPEVEAVLAGDDGISR
jgi:2-dehydro-3-deoxygluconokinase